MTLSGFLRENKKIKETVKYIASTSFIDENDNPLEWELKNISCKKDEAIKKDCYKTNKKGTEFDYETYGLKLAVESIVSPNLNDAELQNSYGVMGAEALLCEMLSPGELQKLKTKAQEVNGYVETIDSLVEEAKN